MPDVESSSAPAARSAGRRSGGDESPIAQFVNNISALLGLRSTKTPTHPFVAGALLGLLIGGIIFHSHGSVRAERAKLSILRSSDSVKAETISRELAKCNDARQQAAQLENMGASANTVVDLKGQLEEVQAELTRCDSKCGHCGDVEVAMKRAQRTCEDEHHNSHKANDRRVEEAERRREQAERERDDLQVECQAKTDTAVKTSTAKILREAEESRRELDLQLHNENLKHDASAERAIRARDLAIQDRDTCLSDKKGVESQLESCLAGAATAVKERDARTQKVSGELESFQEQAGSCMQEKVSLETALCQICDYAATSFPSCAKVCGVNRKETVQGEEGARAAAQEEMDAAKTGDGAALNAAIEKTRR
ncbi:hypothetical protein NFJ02_11g04350 [Pycnococcus provasolii]